jgi:hypothetical protein
VSVHGLGWLGVRTDRFGQTVALYSDVALEPFHAERGPDGNVYEIISGAGNAA